MDRSTCTSEISLDCNDGEIIPNTPTEDIVDLIIFCVHWLHSVLQAYKCSFIVRLNNPDSKYVGQWMGTHLASPIMGELGYADRPQLGYQIYCPIENQFWGPLGKEDVCPNSALTNTIFVFSNSGNFRAKANPPKPRSCPKSTFGQWLWPNSSADWEAHFKKRVYNIGYYIGKNVNSFPRDQRINPIRALRTSTCVSTHTCSWFSKIHNFRDVRWNQCKRINDRTVPIYNHLLISGFVEFFVQVCYLFQKSR